MSDLTKRVGDMIKSRRKGKNMSQAQLAEKVGMSTKYLGEVERGEGNISIEKLERVSLALDSSLGEMFDNSHKAGRELLTAEIRDMVYKANKKDVELIYKIVKSIIERKFKQ